MRLYLVHEIESYDHTVPSWHDCSNGKTADGYPEGTKYINPAQEIKFSLTPRNVEYLWIIFSLCYREEIRNIKQAKLLTSRYTIWRRHKAFLQKNVDNRTYWRSINQSQNKLIMLQKKHNNALLIYVYWLLARLKT